ncbi:hypothetical protein GPECTOR_30g183 [Gonium pectorale]|uniref:SET domain-containing protein n=1 Tax=Gonium pectorale TaxID=33097 RepID=A0A150GE50_GONPE|nr:hypothetical protein GPECTOR_30g183 [Gonium pectorale]|eukprot:KXZ48088.1 hypothetical protein GPECTOR_30g183 [Gonium pectorale]
MALDTVTRVSVQGLGLQGPGWLRLSVLQPGCEALLELASEDEVPAGRLLLRQRRHWDQAQPRRRGAGHLEDKSGGKAAAGEESGGKEAASSSDMETGDRGTADVASDSGSDDEGGAAASDTDNDSEADSDDEAAGAATGGGMGEVRVCGLTFDAALAPAARSAQAAWLAGLGRELRYADPTRDQLALGLSGTAKQLSRAVVCNKLARLLGLEGDDGCPDAPLPEGPVVLEGVLRPCGDPSRGGAGLQVAEPIRRNEVLGVVGGYVMPADAARDFLSTGHKECRPEIAARLTAVAEGTRADAVTAWRLLAGAFRMPLPADMQPLQGLPVTAELSMLGYGNLAALVNDPRVNPRDWRAENDVDSQEAAAKANCAVVPVCVRGLVLPVLVALRDIAPGEQLMRNYGADWWHDLADAWEVAEHDGLDVARLLHGTQLPPAERVP